MLKRTMPSSRQKPLYRVKNWPEYEKARSRKRNPKVAGVFTYNELMARDKVNLDILWLHDESLENSANLPHP